MAPLLENLVTFDQRAPVAQKIMQLYPNYYWAMDDKTPIASKEKYLLSKSSTVAKFMSNVGKYIRNTSSKQTLFFLVNRT